MSDTTWNAFAEHARHDPALAEDAARAVGDRRGDEAVEALAAFARERGYDVDPATLGRAGATDGELSDSELGAVSGGTDILRRIWGLPGTILG